MSDAYDGKTRVSGRNNEGSAMPRGHRMAAYSFMHAAASFFKYANDASDTASNDDRCLHLLMETRGVIILIFFGIGIGITFT